MIIPIGIDCTVADFFRKYNLRNIALPFDWNVTYNGVSKCIDNNFKSFTELLNDRLNNYDVCFYHDFDNKLSFDEDKQKYIRRCNRLINILETSKENIIFCRKGHSIHHHYEHNGKYCNIKNDIDDVEELNIILSNKYPHLKYKIIVILICEKCFNLHKIYKSNSPNIEIYNIVTPQEITTLQKDAENFENCAREIFRKHIDDIK